MPFRFWISLAALALLAGCASDEERIALLAPPTPIAGDVAGVVRSGSALVQSASISLTPGGVTTSTDANGVFSLAGVAPGTYVVTGSAPGFADGSTEVTVLAGRRSGADLTLGRTSNPGSLEGRVTDGQVGVSGARLALAGSGVTALTAADGTFNFSSLTPGVYNLEVARAGFFTANSIARVAAGRPSRLDLAITRRSDGTLTGRLTDGVRGVATCTRAGVVVLFLGPTTAQRTVPDPGECARSRGVLAPDDRYRFEGLATGSYILQAGASGFRTATKVVTVLGGAENNGDIVMTLDGQRAAITGTVLDETFVPIAAVQVAFSAGSTQLTTRSGADGRYLLANLTPGPAALTLTRAGFGQASIAVSLSPGNTSDGSVVLRR